MNKGVTDAMLSRVRDDIRHSLEGLFSAPFSPFKALRLHFRMLNTTLEDDGTLKNHSGILGRVDPESVRLIDGQIELSFAPVAPVEFINVSFNVEDRDA